jgi:ABC-type polysaccharide/polyol phosphate transport system ATPase subunit
MNAIEISNVSKKYNLGSSGSFQRLLSLSRFKGERGSFWALDNLSFNVRQGAVLGIIGPNGAGKSTILKILAGVTRPDRGTVKVNGRLAPMIELGAGFHTELTGRENTFLNGALMGLSRKEIGERYEQIVEFAELADFMDTPIAKYSSGMLTRLGFAVAVHTDPDILLVDEVLAVGDERFQRKCLNKFLEFRKAGKTVIFVSHDLGLISNICDEAVLLNRGKIVSSGPIDNAMGCYLQMLGDDNGVAIMRQQDLLLIFNNGKGLIYYNNIEITKRLGLNTSILIKKSSEQDAAFWNDSTRFTWKCTQVSKYHIVCIGESISLPIIQKWSIELSDSRHIIININIEITDNIYIEKYQLNLMLSEKYTNWSSSNKYGSFPTEFTTKDYYNWEILNKSTGSPIKASSNGKYPNIELECYNKNIIGTILNSDFHFMGRVLAFIKMENKMHNSAAFNYFDGKITLE